MATKAEKFLATTSMERARRNVSARPKPTRKAAARTATTHQPSARAGRNARVSFESSNGRPSRKSTRGSEHHQRATNQLERTEQLRQSAPKVRAAIARARTVKTRGKP